MIFRQKLQREYVEESKQFLNAVTYVNVKYVNAVTYQARRRPTATDGDRYLWLAVIWHRNPPLDEQICVKGTIGALYQHKY